MQYSYDNKVYQIKYEIDDLSEHMYNVWLDNGRDTIELDQLPEHDQLTIYSMVDEDATEWGCAYAYDRAKDFWKYGE